LPYGIIACRDITGSTAVKKLYCTQPAHPGRLQGFVVTQRRDFNTVFLGDLNDILPFLSLDFGAVNFEGDHVL
jgi:hypothetical protein